MNRPQFLPPDVLARMRFETDPVADKVVASILEEGHDSIHHMFSMLTSNRDVSKLPESSVIRQYFESNSALPEWTDERLLEIGQDVFRRFGVEITMLLFFVSLPSAYSCWRGARVLTETGRLTTRKGNIHRFAHRIMETAQFVIDVMSPGAFLPEGNGTETTLKVRLIHAAIRHFLKNRSEWDVSVLGEPINQEDMAGTLMSFSALVLEGLQNMGARLSTEEQEGYFHCWRVVGHLNGVRPELIPANYQEGLNLGYQIFGDQIGPSKEGEELLDALVTFVVTMLPKHLFGRHFPMLMIRYFMGKNMKDGLKFQKVPAYERWFMDALFRLVLTINRLLKRPQHYLVEGHIGRTRNHFLQKMVQYYNDHKEINFEIPPSLQEDWHS